MSKYQLTRRGILKAGVVALPLAAAGEALSQEAPEGKGSVVIGMATTGFRDYTNSRLATELAKRNVRTIQLFLSQSDSNYWRYNSRNDLTALTAERCKEIAGTYRSAGISIHSIGVYTNLIHPDEAERKANLAYFEAMMKVGGHMGVRTFITEAGHYHAEKPASREPHHFQEHVWKTMVATAKQLAKIADGHNATVLVEPYFQSFLASAKRTRVFLEEVGSPRIRALLDPANLLELNDLEEMFAQLTPWIDCLHAKDRKLHTRQGVPAGQGDIDYPKFVTLAAKHTPKAPLILEYVGSKDCDQAIGHLRKMLREAGVSERSTT
ncbi:MAG: sugar phosphate isomerase/epimerase [Candidatus Brocadiae bacterium]|nr:sugar phosphate isomerase/epimerase [Candidatus Brocadiia bacterium]